ncbi:MAG TPA: SDR family oxidoreductase, partial [Herpetosiphonaceae bacterium]
AVNFIYPYARLKAANVDGTREVLRLASTAATKPVHFISTLAVYAPEDYLSRPLRESDPPDNHAGIAHGYEQSKWVADRMLRTAQERGLPVTIYRPARITGDSASGASNLDDFMVRLVAGCAQLGKAPAVMDAMDMLPVDYLSAAIVRFSLLAEAPGRSLHFFNEPAIPFGQVLDWLAERGYPLERAPFAEWRAELTARAQAGADNALAPLAPLFWLQPFDGRPPLFDSSATFDALRRLGMPPPAANEALFARYLAFLRRAGLLPQMGQRRPGPSSDGQSDG